MENTIWTLVKNKLPDFKLAVERKSDKTIDITNQINRYNDLIETVNTVSLPKLKEKRKRVNDVYIDLGDDFESYKQKVNEINRQIKEHEYLITEYKSQINSLSISLQNLDVAEEIERNIQLIESNKNNIAEYLNKLINRITIESGLSGYPGRRAAKTARDPIAAPAPHRKTEAVT